MRPLALVFGGSRGIGKACVEALRNDFEVVATSTAQVDIRNPDQIREAFEKLGKPVSCVVVNAGINVPPGPLAQFDPVKFRELVEVNIVGAFNVLAEAARRVADGGSIVALTTSLVRHAAPGLGPYSASKAAVESLVRSLAKELSARKVRVNAVAPGPVDTELFHAGKTDEAKARMAALSPFNRIGRPAEVAALVAFLVSEKASWIQGQIVQPNGGMV
jgi:3-oxoacyl-[acyl-carrier protein] reductase